MLKLVIAAAAVASAPLIAQTTPTNTPAQSTNCGEAARSSSGQATAAARRQRPNPLGSTPTDHDPLGERAVPNSGNMAQGAQINGGVTTSRGGSIGGGTAGTARQTGVANCARMRR